MAKLAIFFAIALIGGHVTVAQAREGYPGLQASVQIAAYSSDNAEVPTENQLPGPDGAGQSSPVKPAQSRGQPRVSKTRCAIVTCEAPCEAESKQEAPGNVPTATQRAPCPVRQAMS